MVSHEPEFQNQVMDYFWKNTVKLIKKNWFVRQEPGWKVTGKQICSLWFVVCASFSPLTFYLSRLSSPVSPLVKR